MLCQLRISLSVCAPLIYGLGLLGFSHNNGNIHICFVFTLLNIVLQNIILEAAVTAFIDDTEPMKLSMLANAIVQDYTKVNVEVPIVMTD